MQDFLPQLIQFNIPFIFVLLVAGAAAVITIFYYRKTNPGIHTLPRYFLGGLRGIILFLILLLFFAPTFFIQIRSTEKPRIGLFLDNSRSMGDSSRWEDTKRIYYILQEQLNSVSETELAEFNDQVLTLKDKPIEISGTATDYTKLLDYIKKSDFDKAVIISDGNHTESSYPLPEAWPYKTAIFTVGMGRADRNNDLSVTNVDYSPIIYAGKKTEVIAEISSEGIKENTKVRIALKSGNKVIATKYVYAGSGDNTQIVSFEYTPNGTGLKRYSVEADPLSQETNVLNNTSTFVQNTLKNKIRVGIIGSKPQYETRFLNLILQTLEDVESYTFTEKPGGRFFQSRNDRYLDSLDVMILCGFPGTRTPENLNNQIRQILRVKQTSLVFFLNELTDFRKLNTYSGFLPFAKQPVKSAVQQVIVNPPGILNLPPALIVFDNNDLVSQFWTKIPPVMVNTRSIDFLRGTQTLVDGSNNKGLIPVIATHESKDSRMVLFNGQGFWKWHFYFQNNPELIGGYTNLMKNVLRWVTDKAKLKPVMITTQRNSGYPGETIILNGFLFDGQFEPIKDGSMVVEAEWNDQKFEIEAQSDSSGSFDIVFIPPSEGHYEIVASGYRDGIKIGVDRIEMEVIPVEKEFLKTSQNVEFLKKLAGMGNGKYYDSSEADSVMADLNLKNKINIDEKMIEVWYHPVLLGLILLLITIEWIVRKRLGLV